MYNATTMENTSQPPKKILIVEDEKPLAQALQMKLRETGFDVITAGDGEEAMRKVNEDHFDLILLDLVMPKMDGFMFLEELQRKQSASVPVLVLSNSSQEEDKKKAMSYGVLEFFVKANTQITEIIGYIQKFFEGGTETA